MCTLFDCRKGSKCMYIILHKVKKEREIERETDEETERERERDGLALKFTWLWCAPDLIYVMCGNIIFGAYVSAMLASIYFVS